MQGAAAAIDPDLRPAPHETLSFLTGDWRIFQLRDGHRCVCEGGGDEAGWLGGMYSAKRETAGVCLAVYIRSDDSANQIWMPAVSK